MPASGATTEERLIAAATALLDAGGEKAVTLRAVGQGAGVSHNAPYKHFANRNALLGAVALSGFTELADAFEQIRASTREPDDKLFAALDFMIGYARAWPRRYELLFGNPAIAAEEGALRQVALRASDNFAALVEECQASGRLPRAPNKTLAGLLFASLHGLLAFEATGLTHPEKGFIGSGPSMRMLIRLIAQGPSGPQDSA